MVNFEEIKAKLLTFYFFLEEKYYSVLDAVEEKLRIPVYEWVVNPIESRGIPSFPIVSSGVFLFLVAIVFGAVALFAPQMETVTINLLVGDAEFSGATITLSGEGFQTQEVNVSSANFQLGLPKGKRLQISISAPGFRTANQFFVVGEQTTLPIRLASDKAGSLAPQDVEIINYYELADNDFNRMLLAQEKIPIIPLGNGKLAVRLTNSKWQALLSKGAQLAPDDAAKFNAVTKATVVVRVVEGATPIGDAEVVLYNAFTDTEIARTLAVSGTARFEGVEIPENGLKIYATAEAAQFSSGKSEEKTVVRDSTSVLKVELTQLITKGPTANANSNTIRVVDEDKKAIQADLLIQSTAKDEAIKQDRTDSAGVYTFATLKTKSYQVTVFKQGYIYSSVLVSPIDTVKDNEVVLKKATDQNSAKLDIRIADSKNETLTSSRNLTILLLDSNGLQLPPLNSQSQTKFGQLPGFPRGSKVSIKASALAYTTPVKGPIIAVDPTITLSNLDNFVEIILDLPTGKVKMIALDSDKKIVAKKVKFSAFAKINDTSIASTASQSCETTSGSCELNLQIGKKFLINATSDFFAPSTETIEVKTVELQEKNITFSTKLERVWLKANPRESEANSANLPPSLIIDYTYNATFEAHADASASNLKVLFIVSNDSLPERQIWIENVSSISSNAVYPYKVEQYNSTSCEVSTFSPLSKAVAVVAYYNTSTPNFPTTFPIVLNLRVNSKLLHEKVQINHSISVTLEGEETYYPSSSSTSSANWCKSAKASIQKTISSCGGLNSGCCNLQSSPFKDGNDNALACNPEQSLSCDTTAAGFAFGKCSLCGQIDGPCCVQNIGNANARVCGDGLQCKSATGDISKGGVCKPATLCVSDGIVKVADNANVCCAEGNSASIKPAGQCPSPKCSDPNFCPPAGNQLNTACKFEFSSEICVNPNSRAGSEGQPCRPKTATTDPCIAGLSCGSNGMCQKCGALGDTCCSKDYGWNANGAKTCQTGLQCSTSNKCQLATKCYNDFCTGNQACCFNPATNLQSCTDRSQCTAPKQVKECDSAGGTSCAIGQYCDATSLTGSPSCQACNAGLSWCAGKCGSEDQAACAGDPKCSTSSQLTIVNLQSVGMCVACGGLEMPACNGVTCSQGAAVNVDASALTSSGFAYYAAATDKFKYATTSPMPYCLDCGKLPSKAVVGAKEILRIYPACSGSTPCVESSKNINGICRECGKAGYPACPNEACQAGTSKTPYSESIKALIGETYGGLKYLDYFPPNGDYCVSGEGMICPTDDYCYSFQLFEGSNEVKDNSKVELNKDVKAKLKVKALKSVDLKYSVEYVEKGAGSGKTPKSGDPITGAVQLSSEGSREIEITFPGSSSDVDVTASASLGVTLGSKTGYKQIAFKFGNGGELKPTAALAEDGLTKDAEGYWCSEKICTKLAEEQDTIFISEDSNGDLLIVDNRVFELEQTRFIVSVKAKAGFTTPAQLDLEKSGTLSSLQSPLVITSAKGLFVVRASSSDQYGSIFFKFDGKQVTKKILFNKAKAPTTATGGAAFGGGCNYLEITGKLENNEPVLLINPGCKNIPMQIDSMFPADGIPANVNLESNFISAAESCQGLTVMDVYYNDNTNLKAKSCIALTTPLMQEGVNGAKGYSSDRADWPTAKYTTDLLTLRQKDVSALRFFGYETTCPLHIEGNNVVYDADGKGFADKGAALDTPVKFTVVVGCKNKPEVKTQFNVNVRASGPQGIRIGFPQYWSTTDDSKWKPAPLSENGTVITSVDNRQITPLLSKQVFDQLGKGVTSEGFFDRWFVNYNSPVSSAEVSKGYLLDWSVMDDRLLDFRVIGLPLTYSEYPKGPEIRFYNRVNKNAIQNERNLNSVFFEQIAPSFDKSDSGYLNGIVDFNAITKRAEEDCKKISYPLSFKSQIGSTYDRHWSLVAKEYASPEQGEYQTVDIQESANRCKKLRTYELAMAEFLKNFPKMEAEKSAFRRSFSKELPVNSVYCTSDANIAIDLYNSQKCKFDLSEWQSSYIVKVSNEVEGEPVSQASSTCGLDNAQPACDGSLGLRGCYQGNGHLAAQYADGSKASISCYACGGEDQAPCKGETNYGKTGASRPWCEDGFTTFIQSGEYVNCNAATSEPKVKYDSSKDISCGTIDKPPCPEFIGDKIQTVCKAGLSKSGDKCISSTTSSSTQTSSSSIPITTITVTKYPLMPYVLFKDITKEPFVYGMIFAEYSDKIKPVFEASKLIIPQDDWTNFANCKVRKAIYGLNVFNDGNRFTYRLFDPGFEDANSKCDLKNIQFYRACNLRYFGTSYLNSNTFDKLDSKTAGEKAYLESKLYCYFNYQPLGYSDCSVTLDTNSYCSKLAATDCPSNPPISYYSSKPPLNYISKLSEPKCTVSDSSCKSSENETHAVGTNCLFSLVDSNDACFSQLRSLTPQASLPITGFNFRKGPVSCSEDPGNVWSDAWWNKITSG